LADGRSTLDLIASMVAYAAQLRRSRAWAAAADAASISSATSGAETETDRCRDALLRNSDAWRLLCRLDEDGALLVRPTSTWHGAASTGLLRGLRRSRHPRVTVRMPVCGCWLRRSAEPERSVAVAPRSSTPRG
jgi:hypothetical protein